MAHPGYVYDGEIRDGSRERPRMSLRVSLRGAMRFAYCSPRATVNDMVATLTAFVADKLEPLSKAGSLIRLDIGTTEGKLICRH
jgi:hypothetical protein